MNTGKVVSIIVVIFGVLLSIGSLVGKYTELLTKKPTVGLFFLGICVVLFALPAIFHYNSKQEVRDTQRVITDKALLKLFERQPGGLLSSKMLAEKTGLTPGEASSRAMTLAQAGALRAGSNGRNTNYFFELTAPLEEASGLELSGEPFLTVGDLQKIFVAYDHKVSPQDLIMATGLPWNVLLRELRHFRKKQVVENIRIARPNDSPLQYVLLEPYLSAPPEGEEALALNAEMKEILYDEDMLV